MLSQSTSPPSADIPIGQRMAQNCHPRIHYSPPFWPYPAMAEPQDYLNRLLATYPGSERIGRTT